MLKYSNDPSKKKESDPIDHFYAENSIDCQTFESFAETTHYHCCCHFNNSISQVYSFHLIICFVFRGKEDGVKWKCGYCSTKDPTVDIEVLYSAIL